MSSTNPFVKMCTIIKTRQFQTLTYIVVHKINKLQCVTRQIRITHVKFTSNRFMFFISNVKNIKIPDGRNFKILKFFQTQNNILNSHVYILNLKTVEKIFWTVKIAIYNLSLKLNFMLINNFQDNISHVSQHIVLIMQAKKFLTTFHTKIN